MRQTAKFSPWDAQTPHVKGLMMATGTLEKKALDLLAALESAGKTVSRVAVEGRRIEIVLASGERVDDCDRIDMRHGKT